MVKKKKIFVQVQTCDNNGVKGAVVTKLPEEFSKEEREDYKAGKGVERFLCKNGTFSMFCSGNDIWKFPPNTSVVNALRGNKKTKHIKIKDSAQEFYRG